MEQCPNTMRITILPSSLSRKKLHKRRYSVKCAEESGRHLGVNALDFQAKPVGVRLSTVAGRISTPWNYEVWSLTQLLCTGLQLHIQPSLWSPWPSMCHWTAEWLLWTESSILAQPADAIRQGSPHTARVPRWHSVQQFKWSTQGLVKHIRHAFRHKPPTSGTRISNLWFVFVLLVLLETLGDSFIFNRKFN